MNALDVQIGGDHYKKYRLPPIQFADANCWPASLSYALKHLTRHQDKLGRQDLEKAKHYIRLRAEHVASHDAPSLFLFDFDQSEWVPISKTPYYTMADYILLNGIPVREATILLSIESWYRQNCRPDHAAILRMIDEAIEHYYLQTNGEPELWTK